MYNHTILESYMPMQKGNIGVKIEYHREKKKKFLDNARNIGSTISTSSA